MTTNQSEEESSKFDPLASVADGEMEQRYRAALRESEQRFRLLADAAPVLIWMSGPHKEGIYFNQTWLDFTGKPIEEQLGEGWLELVHTDDRQRLFDICMEGFRNRKMFTAEFRLRRADGEYRWLLDTGIPRFDSNGAFVGFIGSCVDITDRKLAEEALSASEERLRNAVDAADVGTWRVDLRTGLDTRDASLNRILGLEACESTQPVEDFFARILPEDQSRADQAWRSALGGADLYDVVIRIVRPDGQTRWIRDRGRVVHGADGEPLYATGAIADITERMQAQEALQEADRRKDEFLATLAHELRNPLAPVRHAVQVLKLRGPQIPELQWAHEVIDRQIEQMTRLIDDLLDVSRISRGKIELRRERVELTEVIQAAIEASRPVIDEHGHELTVTLPPEATFLNADLTRLAQVFLNLLNNAAKYTEPGGRINLVAERQESEAVVSVTDTGIGIPADRVGRIFEMFSQIENPLTRSGSGLGIGLSLVKRLVEMHGGTVEAQSEGVSKGSKFVVRLPIEIERYESLRASEENGQEQAASELRILVVDDNRAAAATLAMLLKVTGHTVRTAHDGEEALAAAEEFRPQVVLLDVGLPNLNGYDVCRRIRELPWGKSMILIAVTGWGQDEDKQQAHEAGFDQHLVKPVDPQALVKWLAALHVTPEDPQLICS